MGNIILFFFLLIILFNFELVYGLKINLVSPLFIQVYEDGREGIILTFDQSMKNEQKEELILSPLSGNGNQIKIKSYNEINNDDENKVFFRFLHNDFLENGYEYGKYNLSYGADKITYSEPILIYSEDIELINPKERYFLNEGTDKINASFEFIKNKIVKDQINRITYFEEDHPNDIKNLSREDYDISDDGATLNIKFARTINAVKTFTFKIYSEINKDISNPPSFKLYFQDFFVLNEAVYANETVDSPIVFFQIEFRQNQFDEYQFGTGFVGENSVSLIKINFTKIENNLYYYFFKIQNKPSPGKIILIFNKNNIRQERPIFLMTYQTDKNKCYLADSDEIFDITFKTITEMEYTHSVLFNTSYGAGLKGSRDNNEIKYIIYISTLYSGTFHLYSRLAKLSSNKENHIDNSSLFIRIYKDPNLQDNKTEYIFTNINSAQNVTFTIKSNLDINEIFLVNSTNKQISLYLNRCIKNNKDDQNIYSCNLTNIRDNYIGEYYVEYNCGCDNKRLKISDKKIIIEKGIFLNNINPKWCFIDEINSKKITLTYSETININNINIQFCDSNYNNCIERVVESTNGKTVTINSTGLKEDIYYIKTTIKEQEIKNDDIKFKIVPRLKFNFSHHYFVKNNGANENYLDITKTFADNNKIYLIRDDRNYNLNTKDNKTFRYEINSESEPRFGITFKYLDVDINEYIPINDSIAIVDDINRLITVRNIKKCYYYLFSFSASFSPNTQFKERIFLVNNNEKIEFEKNQSNNEYIIINKKKIYDLIDKDLFLYISEETIDTTVYLYKSSIKFTNIKVPEYVIYNNNTIYFSNISCNLCDSTFYIKRNSINFNINNNCQYLADKSMTTSGIFYYDYNYYSYTVDGQDIIIDINNQEKQKTFISNRLDISKFEINPNDNFNNTFYKITIVNSDKDFYFKLISSLTLYKIINGNNNRMIILNETHPSHQFEISKTDHTISFVMEKGNYELDINHITRKNETWEGNLGNTIYHFFNYVYKSDIFSISPSVFASHDFTKESISFDITFINKELLDSFKGSIDTICINPQYIDNVKAKCTLDTSSIENKAQKYTKYIKDYPIILDLIYFDINTQKKCITLKDKNTKLDLVIYSPDQSYLNEIYLNNGLYSKSIDEPKKTITFSLNLEEEYQTLFQYEITGNNDFRKSFYLSEFGIKFLPKYQFEKKEIILLPQSNQKIKITYSGADPDDIENIKCFQIDTINSTKPNKNNEIEITFDLSKINRQKSDYNLYYYDICEEKIDTGITIKILSFTFKRHYFVLNNNNGNDLQFLDIEGTQSTQLTLHIHDDENGNDPSQDEQIMYSLNAKKYRFQIPDIESGHKSYSFYYYNNEVKNEINDKVYVYKELSDLFDDNNTLTNCMYFDLNKSLYFKFNFKEQRKYNSPFIMTFVNENTQYNLTQTSNSDILEYSLSYKDKGKIPKDKALLIYFSENYDTKQPLYLYNYSYTNITLNSKYKDVIYSDAKYLLFNMSCNISKLNAFNIYPKDSQSTEGVIKCESIDDYIENHVYKCNLNKNNSLLNPFKDPKLAHGYYNLKYGTDSIVEKDFYFSREIISSIFNLEKEEDIAPVSYTNFKINSLNNMFYMPYVANITFDKCIEDNCNDKTIQNKNNFKVDNNKIETSLYIESKKNIYYFTQICRNVCDYCENPDCKNLTKGNDTIIASNIPEIFFEFNRYFISLQDSFLGEQKSNELRIKFTGDEAPKLEKITYCINKTDCPGIEIKDFKYDEEYVMRNLQFGIYTFKYKANDNPKFYDVKGKIIFVVNHDYELLNINDLDENCIYYDSKNFRLFSALTINDSYIFKQNASNALKNLTIFFGNSRFNYISDNSGYELYPEDLWLFYCEKGRGYNYNVIENNNPNIIFTKLSSQKNCTDLTLIDFLYKDNIILKDLTCPLNNIYLRELNVPNYEVRLNCEFNSSAGESYCYINKTFDVPNINYNVYFKYGNTLLNKGQLLHIYNSINDSSFDIDFSEPVLSIISKNFDMRNLSQVIIDNNLIKNTTDFFDPLIDNVTFIYYLPNDSLKHNLTKLIREDHYYDRPNTIKHKDLNIRILELQCPEFRKAYGSQCWDCASLIIKDAISNDRIWAQGGDCVTKCDLELDYGIYDQNNHYCRICKEKTKSKDLRTGEDIYYCSCLIGTVKSMEDDMCYLPEMDEITKLTNIQRNTQCYKTDRKTHNYCNPNNTLNCVVENINGYFFPFCTCEEGFTGKYCEFEENKIDLTENIDFILSDNNIINEANITIVSKIRGISFFLEIESSLYMKQLEDNSISLYIDSSVQIFEEIINNGRKTVPQIFDVVELAICFLSHRINMNKLRNLQDVDNDREKLNYLLNNLHYINVQANKNSTYNYKIQTDRLNLTTFIVYKNHDLGDESFKLEMANLSFFKIMEYIDLNNNKINDDDLIFVTLINSSLFEDEENKQDDFGVRAYFSTINDININSNLNNTNYIHEMTNFTFYISSAVIHFNFHLAEYYFNKNIKIYDKNDDAFVDPCFLSENFDFDLTQKYRKNNVFQKMNYGNEVCKYVNFEYKYKRLTFLCEKFSYYNQTHNLAYGMLDFNIQKESVDKANKVYNLPTKCTKRIKNLGSNWAFWFFLLICVIEIIYCIGIGVLTLGSLKKISFRKGLIQDEFYEIIPYVKESNKIQESLSNSTHIPNYNEKGKERSKNMVNYYNDYDNITTYSSEEEFNKTLPSCILHNFKELHPLAALCRVSLISPLLLNSVLFVFNTLILFGFNALLYYESLIEKRIYDKKRNYFDYPMRKEFHKILLSILCQMGLCVIMKLIILVTLKQRNNFKEALKKCKRTGYLEINNEIVVKSDEFQDEMFMKRIIGSSVMAIIIIFFFYYSVAFCAVYIQTQRNWFFSGIWSLFWNWVVLAPIYIIIISFVEYNKQDLNDSTVYYMKRLFFF